MRSSTSVSGDCCWVCTGFVVNSTLVEYCGDSKPNSSSTVVSGEISKPSLLAMVGVWSKDVGPADCTTVGVGDKDGVEVGAGRNEAEMETEMDGVEAEVCVSGVDDRKTSLDCVVDDPVCSDEEFGVGSVSNVKSAASVGITFSVIWRSGLLDSAVISLGETVGDCRAGTSED